MQCEVRHSQEWQTWWVCLSCNRSLIYCLLPIAVQQPGYKRHSSPQWLDPPADICSRAASFEPPSENEEQTPLTSSLCGGLLLSENRLCKEFCWLNCKRKPLHSIFNFFRSRPWGKESSGNSLFGKWPQEIPVGEWGCEAGKEKESSSY